jgi:hypothetical protein
VLRGVNLTVDKSALIAKYGPDTQDNAMLNIRCQNINGEIWIGSKQWLPPKEWTDTADYEDTITFTDGNRFDFFWLGDWGNEDPVKDIEYVSDTDFYTYMNKTHDFVFAISSIGGPYSVIQHFEIMGK